MPSSIIKIETIPVESGGTSSITFSNIPQTYTDLIIKISGRAATGGAADRFLVSFNGSTANYSLISLNDQAGSAASYTRSSFGDNQLAYFSGSGATANTFGNIEIYIPNYTLSNNKLISVDAVMENNSTTNYNSLLAGLWSQTAAITSLTFTQTTGILQHTTATLYGVTKYVETGTGSKATGGTVTTSGGYTIHTFYTSGMFTPTTNLTADYLVVAGGGGGGGYVGGGGGAGGFRTATGISLTSGTSYSAIIGAGGAGLPYTVSDINGSNGTKSAFNAFSATGGGGGTCWLSLSAGITGGSGGGGGAAQSGNPAYQTGGAGNAGGYSPVEGYAGGNGFSGAYNGGGGGGAGGVGASTATTPNQGGNGGIGASNSYSGTATNYAGGGGGGTNGGTPGGGGTGGGGTGGGGSYNPTSGATNTGGGGGGSGNGTNYGQGNGGSGLIIVRYTT